MSTEQPADPSPQQPAEQAHAEALQDELADTSAEGDPQQQVVDLQNQLLRSQAELENFRKRSRRDMESERKYAALPLLQDLVGVMDNLQRALDAARSAGNDEITQGVEMVASELHRVLDRYGCQPTGEIGAPFDPNFQEAIAQQPSDAHPAGAVMHVHQLGYQLHDRVVRPAQVIVSSGPAADASDSGEPA